MNEYMTRFHDERAGRKKPGWKIGEHLMVSFPGDDTSCYQVFFVHKGKGRPIVDTKFRDLEKAKQFARWVNKVYGDFLPFLIDYPNHDIFTVAQYSIRNGEYYRRVVHGLRLMEYV